MASIYNNTINLSRQPGLRIVAPKHIKYLYLVPTISSCCLVFQVYCNLRVKVKTKCSKLFLAFTLLRRFRAILCRCWTKAL